MNVLTPTLGLGVGYSERYAPTHSRASVQTLVQRPRTQVQRSQDTGPEVPGHRSSGPRTQVLRSDTSDTLDTPDTPDTPTLDTPTRSDTTHASQLSNHPQTPVRHRPDTSDTVDTSVNRHRSDTAPTLLRHLRHLRHSDTSGLKAELDTAQG